MRSFSAVGKSVGVHDFATEAERRRIHIPRTVDARSSASLPPRPDPVAWRAWLRSSRGFWRNHPRNRSNHRVVSRYGSPLGPITRIRRGRFGVIIRRFHWWAREPPGRGCSSAGVNRHSSPGQFDTIAPVPAWETRLARKPGIDANAPARVVRRFHRWNHGGASGEDARRLAIPMAH